MKKIALVIGIIVLLNSCGEKSLKDEFNCKSSGENLELKEFRDALKKFRVKIPKKWKTELYYDEFQSEIYSADTTKGLTDTYIFDIAWHQGELNLEPAFDQSVRDTLAIKEQLSYLRSGFSNFKENPIYWNLSKGTNSGYEYQSLQVYIKTELDEYITFSTKVYGTEAIEERLCQSIAYFYNLEIIN